MSISSDTVFEPVIGLEVHAQLLTESKAFAPVFTEFGAEPNTHVTPLCLGHLGTLPVLNENLVRFIIKMGLATNCKIARKSIFARKNYSSRICRRGIRYHNMKLQSVMMAILI